MYYISYMKQHSNCCYVNIYHIQTILPMLHLKNIICKNIHIFIRYICLKLTIYKQILKYVMIFK